jgi:hypothetical protein
MQTINEGQEATGGDGRRREAAGEAACPLRTPMSRPRSILEQPRGSVSLEWKGSHLFQSLLKDPSSSRAIPVLKETASCMSFQQLSTGQEE